MRRRRAKRSLVPPEACSSCKERDGDALLELYAIMLQGGEGCDLRSLEMSDQDAIEQQRELLAIYRQSLAFHLKQLAKLGEAFAPPGLLHSITEARTNIRALKLKLRQLGVDVEDLALEEDLDDIPAAPSLGRASPQASIYKSLWSKIEELHILVRVQDLDQQAFDKNVQELNIFAIRNSLDIDEEDKQLANQYLQTLYELKALVSTSGDQQEKRSVEITGSLVPEDFQSGIKLQQLVEQVATLRNLLYQRFRHIINANRRG
jgi:hypothetical protein